MPVNLFESALLRGKLQSREHNLEYINVTHRPKISGIFLLLAFPLFCVAASFAADDKNAAAKAREIEDQLIAPCCWTQPVSEHYSEVSEKIRQQVTQMVAAGKSRDEILDFFVAQYGERILATPRAKGFNSLVYILPWLALVLGAWLLLLLLKRWRSQSVAAPAPAPSAPLDPRYASVIEKEMKELEE
jgi:cytochrome c-type biogenesis protein CcmH